MKGSIALLVSGLASQQVAATWNRQATNFNTPQYSNNECSDKQNTGFDWSDINDGQKDFDYGDFNFGGGWTCSNKFGKRDLITKRTFNSKCVKNTVSKETPASFSCDKRKDGFSVKEIDVSVDHDVDLEFHYKMSDGSTCKQTTSCKTEGTTVKNTQCGGAQSVEVYLGSSKENKSSCDIGFHNIRFDCTPGQTYSPPASYTPTPSKSSASKPPQTTSASSTSKASSSSHASSSIVVSSSSKASSSSASSYHFSNSTLSTATKPSSTPVSISASSSVVSSSSQASSSSAPASSTEYVLASSAPSAPASSSKPLTTPAGSTTAPATSSPAPSSSAYPPATPPDVLPKCLNTWIQINTQCKDNTDNACYCKIPDFTKNVIDCVASYSTAEEAQKALQYFIGICAADIPTNPGIISDCPSNIPINPTTSAPAPSTAAATKPASSAPAVSAPAPSAAAPSVPCTTITVGSTTYTVPQVVFTTSTPAPVAPGAPAPSDEPINLVPGTTPAAASATTTGAPYPIPSSLSSSIKPTGTGAVQPSTPAQQFTGAASSLKMQLPAAFVAVIAFFTL
ncbi:hypothetical protein P280DRAFT_487174 [Massarina eburnea CBS 473.64]|uniref:CFEM domain-containing protein n=1 Tax=Massarina eburnea CBS 473.64 TaxID=1395130 RepID=A0A6A6S9R1_9PLEO|nr:hypothetical protein P280DRAFT_487174 [Massarina eburnea CBS 473.64]